MATIVGSIIAAADTSMATNTELARQAGAIVDRLDKCRNRVLEEQEQGYGIEDGMRGDGRTERDGKEEMEWKQWTQSIPSLAFEIARETKEVVRVVEELANGGRGEREDFT